MDITALYTSGRVQAFALLDIFSDNSDSLIIDGQPLVTIPSEKVSGVSYMARACMTVHSQLEELREQFEQVIEPMYKEALQIQAAATPYVVVACTASPCNSRLSPQYDRSAAVDARGVCRPRVQ